MPEYVEPELNNQSVRQQMIADVVTKMGMVWPSRAGRLGAVLVVYDSSTGETVVTARGDPQHMVEAMEQVSRDLKNQPTRLAI